MPALRRDPEAVFIISGGAISNRWSEDPLVSGLPFSR